MDRLGQVRAASAEFEFGAKPDAGSAGPSNASGLFRGTLNTAEDEIATTLLEWTELDSIETPLEDVLAYLTDRHKIVPIHIDHLVLAAAGRDGPMQITANESNVPLVVALNEILAQQGLAWTI